MATFDFIETTSAAYRFVWEERKTLLRLAIIPFAVKFICYVGIFIFGYEEQYLRQGLILLPSYFVEGYFLGTVLHLAAVRKLGMKDFSGRDIYAAMLLYALIKVSMAFIAGLGMETLPELRQGAETEQSPYLFFGALALIIAMIWGFRLIWLYIPVVFGYSMWHYLKALKGFQISFTLIGAWLMCFMPIVLALMLAAQFLALLTGYSQDNPSDLYRFLLVALQSIMDLLASVLASLAIGFGLLEILDNRTHKKE